MQGAEKEWAGAAVTARPEVGFRGENNMNKGNGQTLSLQGSGFQCISGSVEHTGWPLPQGRGRGERSLEPAFMGASRVVLIRQEAGRGQQRIGEGNRLACGQRIARDEKEVLERLLRRGAAIQLDCDRAVAVWSDIPAGDGEQGFVVVGRHASSCVECLSRNITIARAKNLIQSGCGFALRAYQKKAPHCKGSEELERARRKELSIERRRSNEPGQVTWNTLGKKMAPCGRETGRGQHERSTFQLLSEPRQTYGAAQVTRVLRSKKNTPTCHGSWGMKTKTTELSQRQHTPSKETIQEVWTSADAPIPTPCYLLTHDGFFVAMGFTGKRSAEFNLPGWKLNSLIHQVEACRPTQQEDRRHDN